MLLVRVLYSLGEEDAISQGPRYKGYTIGLGCLQPEKGGT